MSLRSFIGSLMVIACGLSRIGVTATSLPNFRVPDSELKALVNELRSLDTNKAGHSEIHVNFQAHTFTNDNTDHASRPLFTRVAPTLLRKNTYALFRALLDNYNRRTGETEHGSADETREIDAFLGAVLASNVMKRTYQFLHAKGHPYAGTERVFEQRMKQLWFGSYSRARGVEDTSGFEHVMVGEANQDGTVGGLHNWIQYYVLESAGKINYQGYLVKRQDVMAAVKFDWENAWKRSGSFLIGTSPEFDMALYTLCFLAHSGSENSCRVDIDNCEVRITSHVTVQRGEIFIGSAYPSAGAINSACRGTTRREN